MPREQGRKSQEPNNKNRFDAGSLFGSCYLVLVISSSTSLSCARMKYFSHLNTAVQLTEQYTGHHAFGDYAKEFFRAHKKYGSTDRRQIMQLCYAGFRTGKSMTGATAADRILTGLFLCSTEPNVLLEHLKPEWNEKALLSLEEKLSMPDHSFSIKNIFPWQEELSEGIDHDAYCRSFLVQPNLFLRIRPGKEEWVKGKLKQEGIVFNEIGEACLALPNASKVDAVLEPDKEAVVQDLSSQHVAQLIHMAGDHLDISSVWDCCAGSGGKSIMAYDILDRIRLTVSDIRLSILENLEQRFLSAGIKSYSGFTADLAANRFDPHDYFSSKTKFDLIIADVPCTGSGTWGRSPEHLSYFDAKQIEPFSLLQKNIVSNSIRLLLPGGAFLYITCSVFKKENEEVVEHIQKNCGLKLQHMQLLKGYDQKADTLFAALFTF
jgi:16S rRNA (cytosine967-C5)-methyltransferase